MHAEYHKDLKETSNACEDTSYIRRPRMQCVWIFFFWRMYGEACERVQSSDWTMYDWACETVWCCKSGGCGTFSVLSVFDRILCMSVCVSLSLPPSLSLSLSFSRSLVLSFSHTHSLSKHFSSLTESLTLTPFIPPCLPTSLSPQSSYYSFCSLWWCCACCSIWLTQ